MESSLQRSIQLFTPVLLGGGCAERASRVGNGYGGISIQPLSPWDIAVISIQFISVATLLGNPVRRFLFRTENVEPFSRVEVSWILSLTMGVALLALILLWLGLYPGLIIPSLTWILSSVALVVNVIIYRKQLLHWRDYVRIFRGLPKFKSRWFIFLFVFIMAVQLAPLAGLWVTPGDDAKLYSLISLRVVESQEIPRNWGAFADPSWYTEYTHLLLPGFSSEVAFLHMLFRVDVPSEVSVLASLLRSLTASTLYVLVWTMTRRRMPSLLAMATYGLMIVEPTFGWFAWGGMAELAAISVLPIAASGTYLLSLRGGTSWRLILWTALLISGMSLLHPFTFFYYWAFLGALSLVLFLRRHFLRGISVWLPMVLGLALGSGPILNSLSQELSVSPLYSTVNPAWTPTLNLSMSVNQAVVSIASRFVTVYGLAATTILLIGLAGLFASRGSFLSQRKIAGVLSLWYLLMFVLHENNPNGLFVIPFPLWYRIDSNRAFGVTSLIVAGSIGLIAESWIRKSISQRPSANILHFRSLPLLMRENRKKFAIAGLFLFLVTAQVVANARVTFGSQSASPVTTDDITAFDWIRTQTPQNATFFVNLADAGSWVPVYAERRIVMPFGVVTNVSLLANYTQVVSAFETNSSSTQSLQFLTSFGVTYIYSGPARIYGRPGFDPVAIIANGRGHFAQAYHQNAVWIFQVV